LAPRARRNLPQRTTQAMKEEKQELRCGQFSSGTIQASARFGFPFSIFGIYRI
jgi:hypothetical protein